ncbi:MAG: HAD-IG family 5'-nucleotidase [Bradymonadaceae bacterium]
MTKPIEDGDDQPEFIESLLDRRQTSGAVDVDRPHQVYCNRDLNMRKVDAIGFDMDYTLAQYHQDAIDALSVEKTLERLVDERGYSEAILEIEPRPEFAIRGLVMDTQRGNIFKIDRHRHVGKVYHGFEELPEDERHEYRQNTIRFNHDRYVLIDTLFALPEAFLYAALVDFLEKHEPGRDHDWRRLYDDIRYCIDLAHRDNSIKDEILADPGEYVAQDPSLALTFHKFRSAGKQLFLLTNSFARYTDRLMSYLLDGVLSEYPTWESYFDIIITGAGKPSFFTERSPFLVVDADGEVQGEEREEFDQGTIYQGGNLRDFERMAGFGGDSILFIGDHIYGDILRSKKSTAWRTAMIVQEMEDELRQVRELQEELGQIEEIDREIERLNEELTYDQGLLYQIDQLIERLENGEADGGLEEASDGELEEPDEETLTNHDLDQLEATREKLNRAQRDMRRRRHELIDQLRETEQSFEEHFNPYWGLIFRLENENTIFGEQVEDYACLYTSRVSNFLNYSPMHYFRAPRQPMPHERF